ncbi:MAG: hypothetical protein OXG69_07250 [bacterium]|nr:hypothetical protein [bacterium]
MYRLPRSSRGAHEITGRGRKRFIAMVVPVAVLVAALGVGGPASGATAQEDVVGDSAVTGSDVRIVARGLGDGRTEFGLQFRSVDGEWGRTRLPERRFFPASPAVGRWLRSSPLDLTATPAGSASGDGAVPVVTDSGGESDPNLFAQVSTSRGRTCAVRRNGAVSCWGDGHLQEWLSTAGLRDVGMIDITANQVGHFHSCVLHRDGTVSCWGFNYYGRLGLGVDNRARYLPERVPGISDAVSLAVGTYHTCVAHRDGGVSCWGYGADGQMGDGSSEHVRSPQRVPGLAGVATVVSAPYASCAIHHDGGLSCWGWQLDRVPRRVPGLSGVVSAAMSRDRTCAVSGGGRVYCWSPELRARPVRVPGIEDADAVTVGDHAVCVVHRDGGVSCWGEKNDAGQLGDGGRGPRSRPFRLEGLTGVTAVSMTGDAPEGEAHSCAVRGDGSLYCWGGNGSGQIGDGGDVDSPVPVAANQPYDVTGEQLPTDPTPLLRVWLDRAITALETDHPWLRRAWDHIRDDAHVRQNVPFAGAVLPTCGVWSGEYKCTVHEMLIQRSSMDLEVVVHELAHVYDFTTGLAPARAWGAVQLYFTTTIDGCAQEPWADGVELLADAMRFLIFPGDGLTYLDHKSPDCASLPAQLSEEAFEVLRAGLADEVPAWYTDNFTNGTDLWAQFLIGRSPTALANLAQEFGGLCTIHWATYPLNPRTVPAAGTDPFC